MKLKSYNWYILLLLLYILALLVFAYWPIIRGTAEF